LCWLPSCDGGIFVLAVYCSSLTCVHAFVHLDILTMKQEKGFALQDILTELHALCYRYDAPPFSPQTNKQTNRSELFGLLLRYSFPGMRFIYFGALTRRLSQQPQWRRCRRRSPQSQTPQPLSPSQSSTTATTITIQTQQNQQTL